jgi:hypothetical protein
MLNLVASLYGKLTESIICATYMNNPRWTECYLEPPSFLDSNGRIRVLPLILFTWSLKIEPSSGVRMHRSGILKLG